MIALIFKFLCLWLSSGCSHNTVILSILKSVSNWIFIRLVTGNNTHQLILIWLNRWIQERGTPRSCQVCGTLATLENINCLVGVCPLLLSIQDTFIDVPMHVYCCFFLQIELWQMSFVMMKGLYLKLWFLNLLWWPTPIIDSIDKSNLVYYSLPTQPTVSLETTFLLLNLHYSRSGNEEKLMSLLTPLNVNCHASDGRKVCTAIHCIYWIPFLLVSR